MAIVSSAQARVLRILAVIALLLGGMSIGPQGPSVAEAQGVIRNLPGCTTTVLPRNDDGSTSSAVPLGFTLKFANNNFTNVFVNNNGNVTFGGSLGQYTPNGLRGDNRQIIAPFFADVDTRGTASSEVTYGSGTSNGQAYFCVNWVNVGYFSAHTDKLNSFQLVLFSVGGNDFDIEFNYDRILWETGDASGGTNGFGGESAHAGFSNGQPCPQPLPAPCPGSLELPGSGVDGGLINGGPFSLVGHGDHPSLLGRYRFPVRNGALPTGTIAGTVVNPNNQGVEGSLVNLCNQVECKHVTSNAQGQYAFPGVPDGIWGLVAFPPPVPSPAATLFSAQVFGLTVQNGLLQPGPSTTLMLTQQRIGRPGVTAGPTLIPGVTGTTVISANRDLLITATRPANCFGGGASYSLTQGTVVISSGVMTDIGGGVFSATVPASALIGKHGPATITITWDCGAPPDFIDVYIDPSGTVKTPAGVPIEGATVTLLRADTAAGPFTQVPNGSTIMSPGNRRNPDLTDAQGVFHWDTITGFYKVRAEKTGCTAVGSAQLFVESAVLPVPPPQLNIDLRLDCPVSTATLNGTVTLQGLTAGSPGYQRPLEIRLFQPGTTTQVGTPFQATTDVNGNFTVTGITPGTYDVEVKDARRVGRIARNLTLVGGTNTRAFGDLLAGDVNGDGSVTLQDYSQLRSAYGRCDGETGYRAGADFSGDNCITLPDYSRLRANYGTTGPLDAPAAP